MNYRNTNKIKWVCTLRCNRVILFTLFSTGELEIYRQKLAAEHQEKIRQHEDRWRQMQLERQAVFDDAFRVDLEEFKEKGTISSTYFFCVFYVVFVYLCI